MSARKDANDPAPEDDFATRLKRLETHVVEIKSAQSHASEELQSYYTGHCCCCVPRPRWSWLNLINPHVASNFRIVANILAILLVYLLSCPSGDTWMIVYELIDLPMRGYFGNNDENVVCVTAKIPSTVPWTFILYVFVIDLCMQVVGSWVYSFLQRHYRIKAIALFAHYSTIFLGPSLMLVNYSDLATLSYIPGWGNLVFVYIGIITCQYVLGTLILLRSTLMIILVSCKKK